MTAGRVSWLLPEGRECYRVYRMRYDAPPGTCLRCGGAVTGGRTGTRAGLRAIIRDRGSKWSGREFSAIHRGCVPAPGDPLHRIRARGRNATQVRA